MKATGSVFKYGDNVDTDVIIPARYLNITDGYELAKHCMEDIDRDFVKNVKIWVPILDKRRSSCYYKKTERTLFFINDRKEVQYAKSIFIIGRQ